MRADRRKMILYGVVLFFVFFFFNKLSLAVRISPGNDFAGKFLHLSNGLSSAFGSILISFNGTDLLVGIAGAAALFLAIVIKRQNGKKFREGIEYGSARWSA